MAEGGGDEHPKGAPSGSPDVFVSYASQDAALANDIVETLERNGLRCWIAPRDVTPGAHYADAIILAISGAKALILVLSDSAIASKHVGKEIERASSKGRAIITLRTGAAPLPPAFEYFLSESQWIDVGVGGVAGVAAKLMEAVRSHLDVSVVGEPRAYSDPQVASRGAAAPSKKWLLAAGVAALALVLAYFAANKLWPGTPVAEQSPVSEIVSATDHVAPAVPEKSVAVLPFVDLSEKHDQEYFSDGMTDDIITDLSKLSGILVIARNSSWTYKGKSVKVQQVAKDLGVRYVLEGSVRREGDTVRINAQLVDALGGQHLWAERYDGSIKDVFALQDKVIGQIVAALAVNITHDERTSRDLVETRSPQAYDALLRGWAHYRQGTEEETKKAIALFEQAIVLDPEYGRAHAAVAAALWRIVQSFWESTTQGGYQRAFDRMEAALVKAKQQPNALAHAVSAEVLSKQGRYDEAFTEIDHAMALAPNDPDNYLSKARILNATGRAARAEESVRWAMRLDPLYSPDYLRTLSISLFHQQRYEEAVGTIESVLTLQTDVADDYVTLIASLGHLGRSNGIPEAIKTFNELSVSAGYNTITVQMFGGWWWYGDIFNYDPVYRDRLMEGLRKAGVPEGAGTDIPFEKYRGLVHKGEDYYEVTGATKIDYKKARTLHDRGVKFVDVRAALGFASGHVPGAYNLDVATELSRDSLSRIVRKDEEFVLSCHGRTCPDSAFASAKAVMWGFKRVYYFAGGFPAWKEAGYPVEASQTN
ncbi:MAG: TIR domain-containing protein [Gammaproteobacteria bacterium]|nr:TIR domain-containing protein [Gammaproteobacteria bacterium]